MNIEVEIIEFKVPYENNKTIFVWGIQPTFTEAFIYESVWKAFSAFGPLYLLKVCPNAAVAEPGFYALIKYFSAAQASQAQRAMEGRGLFQTTPLRVRVSTKKLPSFLSDPSSRRPLSHSRCQDLANHYLGFNGWCTRIITVKDLSSDVDQLGLGAPGPAPAPGPEGSPQERSLRYGCMVELSFPKHQLSCRGVGIAEETFLVSSPEVALLKRGKLQRWARDKAVVQAFEKVLLLTLDKRSGTQQ
ncbi:RAD52 motif-containing protein 1 isoform X2 [Osmerus mordax]|uniref:RAD52 motif-containing protein 1 isoform X2 n=1 Tax=Osmerus mordax TaxID=8014 RepID=UPI003510A0B6